MSGMVYDTTLLESDAVRMSVAPELHGRRQIFTSEREITDANVIAVLEKALPVHLVNRAEIRYLKRYARGIQPILYRQKKYNAEICNKVVVNIASQIVVFKSSEFAGEPIQYVSRSSGTKDRDDEETPIPEKVAAINSMMLAEGKQTKDLNLAHEMFTCGVAYRLVIHDSGRDDAEFLDEAPFEMYIPDTENTFVVRLNDVTKRVVMGVTYVQKEDPSTVEYTVYTPNVTYTIEGVAPGGLEITNRVQHNFGMVSLIEYPCNPNYMGAFEQVIPLLDAINLTQSNRLDGVEQFIQAIMVFEGVDITREQFLELKDLGALKIPPGVNGQSGRVYYLNEQLDQSQTQTLVDDMYQTVLEIVGMPSQGNGNTGDSSNNGAVIMKNGWWNAEARSLETEAMWKMAETDFLKVVLKICMDTNTLDGLKISDVEPKFGRRSYENMQVKTQAFMNLRSAGCPAIQAFKFSKLSRDPESDALEYDNYQEERAAQLDALTNTSDVQMMGSAAGGTDLDGVGDGLEGSESGGGGGDGEEGDALPGADDSQWGTCPVCGTRFKKHSNVQKYDKAKCRRIANRESL